MASNPAPLHTTAAIANNEPALGMCPMCQTPGAISQFAIDAGEAWRCSRCGPHWDAGRLAAVTAYTAWTIDRERGTP
jgi:ribosomal protein L37AE/L43A